MTSTFSWQTLLAFALLHFVFQGQTSLLLWVSLDFLFCILVPYDEKDIYFLCDNFLYTLLSSLTELCASHINHKALSCFQVFAYATSSI